MFKLELVIYKIIKIDLTFYFKSINKNWCNILAI